jgi:hypothetical protein
VAVVMVVNAMLRAQIKAFQELPTQAVVAVAVLVVVISKEVQVVAV